MANILSEFGRRLAKRAKEKHITQDKLAEKINKSVHTIKKWYSGEARPQIEALIELADLLECDIDYLTGRIEKKTHDNKFICDSLGLSESAIDYIKELPPAYKTVLDMLLSDNKDFDDILDDIALAFRYSCKDPENETAESTDPGLICSLIDLEDKKTSKEKKQIALHHVQRAEMVQIKCKDHIKSKVNRLLDNIPPAAPERVTKDIGTIDIEEVYKVAKDFSKE